MKSIFCEDRMTVTNFPKGALPVDGSEEWPTLLPSHHAIYQQNSHLTQASGRNISKHLQRVVCDDYSSLMSVSLLQPPNGASVLASPIKLPLSRFHNLTLLSAVSLSGSRSIHSAGLSFPKLFSPHSPFLAPTPCWTFLSISNLWNDLFVPML